MQLRQSLKQLQDMCTRNNASELAISRNGQLVQIFARHYFERLSNRRVRCNCSNLIERSHHISNGGVRPAGARNLGDFIRRDHSLRPTTHSPDKTPPPGAPEMLLNESLEIRV